mgnify:CR=1 FL=1
MINENVLAERYATNKIKDIFSERGKIILERELWLAVMGAMKKLGVKIPASDIKKFKETKGKINLALIKKIEKKTRHDIKAKIEAYIIAAKAGEHVHKGMTSRDLTDNVEQVQIKRAAEIIFGKYVSVLRHFIDKAKLYRPIIITARTHHQPAQPTLLGRRFSMWAEELAFHLENFEHFLANYPMRGIKGPVGTQFDMLNLLGDQVKVYDLEIKVAEKMGFYTILNSPGQVYPRSLDYALLSHLAILSSACENFTKTIRLMAGHELVTEGFKKGQVGSSAMPHKMNTRSSERICSLAELLKTYANGGSRLSGDQWEEGDVSCSAIRRTIIPDAFYASDGLCETTLTVLNEMGAYPSMIKAELGHYLPFLATTKILMEAVKKGIGRETAHKIIKKYAVAEALRIREAGSKENCLAEKLAMDPIFAEKGITKDFIEKILSDKLHFVGNASGQIDAVDSNVQNIFIRYIIEAKYEPEEIL